MTGQRGLAMLATWLASTVLPLGTAQACPADCDGDRRVEISELTRGVATVLGKTELRFCPQLDANDDGRVGIEDLIAGVSAAIHGCPPPPTPTSTGTPTATATATASPTPVYDPQLPPTDTLNLQAWLDRGLYRDWRKLVEYNSFHWSDGPPWRRAGALYINDSLYASLACHDIPNHPTGTAAVQEVVDLGDTAVVGWLVSHKVQVDSDSGRGWYWFEYVDGNVRTAGRGVVECSGCHGGEPGGVFPSRDFYATFHPQIRPCAGIPESDGGVCTELGLPPLAEPYDGEVESTGTDPRSATLYLRGNWVLLEGAYYYPTGAAGRFNQLFCGSDFPRPVNGELTFLPDDRIAFEYSHLTSDDWSLRFRGRRRAP